MPKNRKGSMSWKIMADRHLNGCQFYRQRVDALLSTDLAAHRHACAHKIEGIPHGFDDALVDGESLLLR